MKRFLLIFLVLCICLSSVFCATAKGDYVKILLNGKNVIFTNDSGFPYVDENNRTMVPLRVTMESAGFAVGYDANKHTAIVITEHGRIEVPIGTNKVYCNNKFIENDTTAVVNNGRTYLPIRAILEASGYTVEWDGNTQSVNAYTFKYNSNEFVPYSTTSLETLTKNILIGNVVYINGQYYATPDYVKMMNNVQVHYSGDDLNTAIYPQKSRFDFAELDTSELERTYGESDSEWISESNFWKLDSEYDFGYVTTPNGLGYGFMKSSGLTGAVSKQIVIKGMPVEFADIDKDVMSFDGYRVKCVNGEIYLNIEDLKINGIIE